MDDSHVIKPKVTLEEADKAVLPSQPPNGEAVSSSSMAPIPDKANAAYWTILKPEYIAPYQPPTDKRTKPEPKPEEEAPVDEHGRKEGDPPATKKAKVSKHAERKAKVQRPDKVDFVNMCHSVAANEPCLRTQTTGECKWSHDIESFLRNEPPSLEGPCPTYRRFGRCRYGLVCRYRADHTRPDEEGKLVNIYDQEKWQAAVEAAKPTFPADVDLTQFESVKLAFNWLPDETNHCGRELQNQLRKRQFPFVKSVLATHQIDTRKQSPNRSYVIIPKERPPTVDFKGKLILAPLTTIGNLPFRRICKRFGADITIGEMALTQQLLSGLPQEWALVHRHESEDVFGVQIAANHVDQAANVVEVLNKRMSVDFIDLNVGCPIDLLCQQGMGSALLTRLSRLDDIVTAMSQTSQVPITVKVRIGRDWEHPVTHAQVAPVVHKWGASALTVHGRSKEQRYRLEANWNYIEQCADVCQVPLIGNGDIYSYEDAEARLASGKIASLMIGRGAIIKPWLFTEIKERRHWDISANERFEILKEFTNNGLDHWGSDSQGVEKTRYFLLNWLSLLNRYIPVGLLERVPIKIGDKAPRFIGRNDLETLMGSPDLDDCLKLSTMLLGPPPANFTFEPKHKAGG